MKTYNLGWGNAVCVRQAFLDGIKAKTVFFQLTDSNLNYPAHNGDEQLIKITRRVIERQVGPTYEHIFLTNGAAGGVTIALRAYAQLGFTHALTMAAPYFPIYPHMIRSAGLNHTTNEVAIDWDEKAVILIDSPSNPKGIITVGTSNLFNSPIIWDAVYHNRVYTAGNYKPLSCNVMVGSYSKLLGLNGIRTGWIATNDGLLAHRLESLIAAEYCGLSSASNAVLLEVLKDYTSKCFWENFEGRARNNLDANRTEWSKLEKYFGDERVSPNGMFYYGPADAACQRLLEKSGIVWTTGNSLGTSNDFARINLGQDCKTVRDAVRQVIKNDKC